MEHSGEGISAPASASGEIRSFRFRDRKKSLRIQAIHLPKMPRQIGSTSPPQNMGQTKKEIVANRGSVMVNIHDENTQSLGAMKLADDRSRCCRFRSNWKAEQFCTRSQTTARKKNGCRLLDSRLSINRLSSEPILTRIVLN